MRQRFVLVFILFTTFFLSGHFSSLATHSSSSAHGCAFPGSQPVSGSSLPAPPIPGKIFINEVLTLPGSRWNCSEPANTYSSSNDSWIELYNSQNQPYNLYAAHATIDSGPGTSPFYLPLGSSIAPQSYLVLFPSTFSGTHLSTNVRLLFGGNPVDEVNIPTLQLDQSFGRVPDGSNSWQIISAPTIDSSNTISTTVPVSTPTVSVPNKDTTSVINSSSAPAPVMGTQIAWNRLQFPTPASIAAPSSKPMPSFTTHSSSPMNNAWDTLHRIIITIITLALAMLLFWCWSLFTSS